MNSSCEIMEMHLVFMAVVPAQGALINLHKYWYVLCFFQDSMALNALIIWLIMLFFELLPADTAVVLMSVKPSFKCGLPHHFS